MSENYVVDIKTCPKCSERMNLMPVVATLPRYTGKDATRVGDPTPTVSLSEPLTIEVYFCPNCRFLELYGA
jgi:hypothetical protein